MDEETTLIDSNTRNEKIKKFILTNKSKLILGIAVLVLSIILLFIFKEFNKKKRIRISNNFNTSIIQYDLNKKKDIHQDLSKIIYEKDPTYSPLALYFIIDNKLIEDQKKINEYFDILINETSLEKEIKNLIIYKKALFNANNIDEIKLLNILNPIINSESVWKSHALYLVAEYFYSNGEKKKSQEFFEKIVTLDNPNPDIINKAKKRLTRDLSD